MRNGKNILRMQADEEDVYHLMDLRERYFVLIGASSLIEGIAAYFLFFQIRCWDLIYLCAALFLGIFLLPGRLSSYPGLLGSALRCPRTA